MLRIMEQQQKKSFLQCRKWNSKKVSYTKYAIINPTKEFSLTLDDASTYLVCYAGIDSDNIRNIGFSVVISRLSSNTKGSVLDVKTEVPQIKLSLNENVLKITATAWGRISAIKLWNSNRPVIETVDRLIDTTSDKKTYDLGVNADEYMIISIQHVDRFGWEYFITRGASINEAQNKWCVIFKANPTGKFNFKMSLLKMK